MPAQERLPSMLELKGICKRYVTQSFTQVALDNVSLSFRDNEFVAILGPSGSGKTTMLNVIGGLDHFDSGDLLIDGISTKDFHDRDWDAYRNNRIGFVFQSYNLIPHQTILENVELALTLTGVGHAECRQRAREALEKVGLGEHVNKRPSQLSGGQQQRVALARMVAAHPGIFMFDEPMSALDSYLKSALEQNMLDLFDVCNRTVLYVSHDIDEACRLCQRICVMHDGHVEEIGSIEDVVRRPQTLAALRLTGCKNTSRARKIGPEEVEALDWGMTFNVGREVPDNVAYLGIRASYFHVDNRAERGRNSYDLHVARVSDSRFERLVLLDVPRADAPTRLQWKVNKVGVPVDELTQAGETLRMHFDASKIHLVCR